MKGVGRGLGTGFDVGVSRCWLGNRSFLFFFFFREQVFLGWCLECCVVLYPDVRLVYCLVFMKEDMICYVGCLKVQIRGC